MKNLLLALITFISVLSLSSCKEVGKARDVANRFYELRQNQQNDKAASLCSEEFYSVTTKDYFVDVLEQIDNNFGKLQSFESSNFNIETKNGKTTTSFRYTVNYENGISNDSIVLIKKGNNYKILYYSYNFE